MVDQDCTMWTLGSFCDPRLNPDEVFERTHVMAGPSPEWNKVTKMVLDLGLGDGQYVEQNTPQEAQAYMMNSMMNRFAFVVSVQGAIGHMVNAYRVDGDLQFRDFQVPPHDGRQVRPLEEPDCIYTIWPINDPE